MVSDEKAVIFCGCYVKLGNIREAALRAGYPADAAMETGLKILGKRKYRRLVEQLRAMFSEDVSERVMCGLERLAFGDASDAVRLVVSEEELSPEEIAGLDLMNVSEIKRVKGGGMEVKLFDRQKALEKMMEYAGNADRRAAAKSLLSALSGADEDGV